jgi:hypothetical protein
VSIDSDKENDNKNEENFGDASSLRSLFTDGIGPGREKAFEPVQLVVTLYTPELEHLDRLRSVLKKSGFGDISRDELVRYGVHLLSERDFLKG